LLRQVLARRRPAGLGDQARHAFRTQLARLPGIPGGLGDPGHGRLPGARSGPHHARPSGRGGNV